MDNQKGTKKNIRKEIIAKRDLLTQDERQAAEIKMITEVTSLDIFVISKKILLFASYGSEIRTDGLIQACLETGKEVYLPKVVGKEICFYTVKSIDDLADDGYKGIREPRGDSSLYDDDFGNSLMIMPGVAFDKDGYRLGYGGGFYDRFLAGKEELVSRSIAIGYKMQEVSALPHDAFDIKPGKIFLY